MSGRIYPEHVHEAMMLIERLCRLQDEVYAEIDPRCTQPADCFCGAGGYWPLRSRDDFRNAGHAVDFIEKATRKELKKRKRRAVERTQE